MRFLISIVVILSFSVMTTAQNRTKYILIDSVSSHPLKRSVNERVEVYKVAMRSRATKDEFPVYNIFFIPGAFEIESKPCDECILSYMYSNEKQKNRLLVTLSILPGRNTKVTKRKISAETVLSMPVLTLISLKEETFLKLRLALIKDRTRDGYDFVPKSENYKVIVKENGSYFLYESTVLAEFYRIASNDYVYYPIDNDNITINPIARPFTISEFKDIFRNGVLVTADGMLNERYKNKIDQSRLYWRIFRDGEKRILGNGIETERFWSIVPNTIVRTDKSLRFLMGIGTFDFNGTFGILGGSYRYYFDRSFTNPSTSKRAFEIGSNNYFEAYLINEIPVKDLVLR